MASGGEEPKTPRIVSLCSDSLVECDPCEAEGKQEEATGYCQKCREYLCENCYICHTKPTPMKNHSLIRLTVVEGHASEPSSLVETHSMRLTGEPSSHLASTSMGQTGESSSLLDSASMRLTEKCVEHEEVIKYFCETHEKLSCDVCMTVHHRNCTDVSYIPVVARDTRGGNEYHEFSKQMKLTENKANGVITEARTKIEMIQHSHSTAKTARQEFKEELDNILDKQLAKLNILAVASELKETERLDSIINSFTATLTEIQTLSNMLDNPQRRTNQCSLYIALKRAKEKLTYIEQLLQTVQLPEVKECRFEPGKELTELLRKGNAFGKTVIEPVRETKVTHHKDIYVRTQSDSEECKITALTLLPNNRLVAIDNKNKKLKLIDTRKSKVVAWLRFSHPLWDVAKIRDGKVAITVPEGERLAIVKTEHELVIENYIKVSGRCYGVACTGDTLIVSFTDTFPDKVELLDLQGKVLRSVATDKAGEWIFSGPKYVSYNSTSRKVYISNWESHTIVTMAQDGHIRSVDNIDDLNMPGKVVHDGKCRLYVSDIQTNTVLQLSADLGKARKLLTGLNGLFGPNCACYENEIDKLFIGMSIATIKVFQLH